MRARYTAHGGAERFVARALQALAKSSAEALDLAVIARRWDRSLERQEGVRVVRCDPGYVGSTWRDASFARAVRAHLAGERYDLVQSHERIAGLPLYRAGDGVHAAWLERRARALPGMRRLAMALDPHHAYLMRTERAMFEHPALRAVICNSTLVRDEIASRFAIDPAKLVLVRNGVDVRRFHPSARDAHRASTRARLGTADDAAVFVLVGSGFERKGVALALDALVAVPEAMLVVVGADRHRARYEARAVALGIERRVRFTGAVDDPLPYLAAADAFVLPTLYDPFPNAVLEAWATGLPVITSDASGAAELVEEGINGWVVDAYDAEPTVAAMREVVSRDAGRIVSMSAAAHRTAVPLSLDALGVHLVTLYRRLLAGDASS